MTVDAECGRFRGVYMCLFQKEGQREPCDKCPNAPEQLRARIAALEAEARGDK